MIYFITGASGVGKTTLLGQLRDKYHDKPWSFLHFDQIGVPALDDMEREYGSPRAWQQAKTFEWIDKLIADRRVENLFFEGQVDPHFIAAGFGRHRFKNYQMILLDADEDQVQQRLLLRGQPELFTGAMKNWLRYLRTQAAELGIPILLTSDVTPQQLLLRFENLVPGLGV